MADAFWNRKAVATPPLTKAERQRWPLGAALPVARWLLHSLAPVCARIEIAGSIRRLSPTVGDIELLCVPRLVPSMEDLFGGPGLPSALLDSYLLGLAELGQLRPRVNAEGRKAGYGPLNKLMLHVPSGIPVDLFVATEENWGMFLLVRTGPAAFNEMLFGHLNYLGYKPHAYGGVTVPGNRDDIACPDEETVFKLAGWPFIPPEQRAAWKPERLNTWRSRA